MDLAKGPRCSSADSRMVSQLVGVRLARSTYDHPLLGKARQRRQHAAPEQASATAQGINTQRVVPRGNCVGIQVEDGGPGIYVFRGYVRGLPLPLCAARRRSSPCLTAWGPSWLGFADGCNKLLSPRIPDTRERLLA